MNRQARRRTRNPRSAANRLAFVALSPCLLGLFLISQSGCAYTGSFKEYLHNSFKVGPEFKPPLATVESHWIDEGNPRISSEPERHDNWWLVFDDPQMAMLVQRTRDQNLTLRESGLRILEARTELGIAVGSLFPQQQEVTGAYRRTQISKTTIENEPLIDANVPRSFDRWSTGFDAAWELDVWGKFRRSIEAADARLNASVEEYDDLLLTLLAETASAYVELRTFEERIRLAQLNIEAQEGMLKIASSRYASGVTDELDVFQAETNVANTKAKIPQLEVRRREAQIRLSVLMGVPPHNLNDELEAAPIPLAPETVVVGIPAELLRRRPDIRRAEWSAAEQSAKIGVAASDLLPQFALRGALRYESNRIDDLLQGSSQAGFVSPGFQWDVLNYGRIKNNVQLQDTRFQRLLVAYEKTVLDANAEVELAIISFIEGHKAIEYLSQSVEANRNALKVATDQYRLGDTNYNQIFTLQAFLVEEQDALAEAQGAVSRSLIRIYKALGGGWASECGEDCISCDGGNDIVESPPEMVESPPSIYLDFSTSEEISPLPQVPKDVAEE